jgi:hypothetical protein
MPAFFVSQNKIWKLPAIGLCMLLLSALLVACGGTPDTNFELFVPTSVTAVPEVSSDATFRDKVLLPNRGTEIVGQDVTVYRTAQSLADLQNTYNTEMTKRGWTNTSASILKSDELGNNGVVLAFEKPLADASKKRVIGIILLGPEAKSTILDPYRASGTLPKDQNVVIAVQGGTAPVPAAEATPTK